MKKKKIVRSLITLFATSTYTKLKARSFEPIKFFLYFDHLKHSKRVFAFLCNFKYSVRLASVKVRYTVTTEHDGLLSYRVSKIRENNFPAFSIHPHPIGGNLITARSIKVRCNVKF